MKAAYYTGNKTFAIESVQPVAPSEGEVQVSVAYCGICGTDLHVFHGAMDARVGRVLAELEADGLIPDDIRIHPVDDQAIYIRNALRNAVLAALSGALEEFKSTGTW